MMTSQGGHDDDDDLDCPWQWSPRGPTEAPMGSRPTSRTSIANWSVRAFDSTVPDDPVTAIARLQCFDGSFRLDKSLCKLIFGDKRKLKGLRKAIPTFIRSLPEAEKIWASAIAVAYLKTKASDSKDVWVGLWEKAKNYAAHALAGSALSFDQVVPDAEQLL